jgi:uncharacterized membrane protein YeiH
MTDRSQRLIFALDLAGTMVFALEGAGAAMESRLDLLGVLVIAFVTALGGGIARDVLIGAAPPQAFRDWRYPAMAFGAGVAAFVFSQIVLQIPHGALIVLDAAGLALFAVAGTEKALDHGLGALTAVLMGGVTGVGGGVVRDLLLAKVPAVLNRDIYASAALAGAAAMVVGRRLGLSNAWAAALGAAACFGLRLAAAHWRWELPRAG